MRVLFFDPDRDPDSSSALHSLYLLWRDIIATVRGTVLYPCFPEHFLYPGIEEDKLFDFHLIKFLSYSGKSFLESFNVFRSGKAYHGCDMCRSTRSNEVLQCFQLQCEARWFGSPVRQENSSSFVPFKLTLTWRFS